MMLIWLGIDILILAAIIFFFRLIKGKMPSLNDFIAMSIGSMEISIVLFFLIGLFLAFI